MTTLPTPAYVLRLERCPICAYALDGLPEEGVCPECGRRYDQQMIVLHGWARGTRAMVTNSRSTKLRWLWGTVVVLHIPMLLVAIQRGTGALAPLIMIFGFGIPLAASIMIKREPTDLPPVQIRVNRAGCVQCDTPPHASKQALLQRVHTYSGPIMGFIFITIAIVSGQYSMLIAMLIGLAVAIAMFWMVFHSQRRNSAINDPDVRRLQDGAPLGFWHRRMTMTSWRRVEDVNVVPTHDGCHIKIVRSNSWYAGHAVDVEVICSAALADALAARIAKWREVQSS